MSITKFDNLIDGRDVITRIEQLQDMYQIHITAGKTDLFEYDTELNALLALAADASEICSNWEYGETLIRFDYFTEYIKDLLSDFDFIYNLPGYIIVDWEQTAEIMLPDYSIVTFYDVDYLVSNC